MLKIYYHLYRLAIWTWLDSSLESKLLESSTYCMEKRTKYHYQLSSVLKSIALTALYPFTTVLLMSPNVCSSIHSRKCSQDCKVFIDQISMLNVAFIFPVASLRSLLRKTQLPLISSCVHVPGNQSKVTSCEDAAVEKFSDALWICPSDL